MKAFLFTLTLVSAVLTSCGAASETEVQRDPVRDHRKPKADLVVKSIQIQNVLVDDVSGARSQVVRISVQNIGNRAVQATQNVVRMNGVNYNASVYGPAPGIPNSYNLGAAIGAAQMGFLSFYLPLGTLRHCQVLSGQIDANRQLQFGPDAQVFNNDSLAVVPVIDRSNIRACMGPVIGR